MERGTCGHNLGGRVFLDPLEMSDFHSGFCQNPLDLFKHRPGRGTGGSGNKEAALSMFQDDLPRFLDLPAAEATARGLKIAE
jgi:hypothetical protein